MTERSQIEQRRLSALAKGRAKLPGRYSWDAGLGGSRGVLGEDDA